MDGRRVLRRALLATVAGLLLAPAGALALAPPEIFLRELDASERPQGDWLPAGSTLRSINGWQVGIRLQDAGTPGNRQRILLRVDAVPDGTPDQRDIYSTSLCFPQTGAPGTIVGLEDKLRYEGPGGYAITATVSTGSDASANCGAGPATTSSWTAAPTIAARFVGRLFLLEPDTFEGTDPPFGGIEVAPPFGAGATEVLCARNPVRRPDGSLGGATTKRSEGRGAVRVRIDDEDLFSRPGRWACVARGNGRAAGPWSAPTPTRAVVTGFYGFRDGTVRLADATGPRFLVTARLAVPESAGGLLTVLGRRNGARPRRVARVRVARGGRVSIPLLLPGAAGWSFSIAYGGNALVAARPAFPELAFGVERIGRAFRAAFGPPCAPRRC